MPLFKKKIQDADLELVIGQLLRYGVILSSVIVAAGGVVYLYRHGAEQPRFSQFKGEPDKMKSLSPMWQSILRGEGRPLIQLGLCVLIATPIARIALSIIGYLLEKDYLYLVLTLVVLTIILWNF
jgi:uncharacterized membrane protein